ncbi:MAG TPA: serine/threonine-protein kinase [Kofleriaceae bacterium]|nr:serine/threonine-protein kinase [Kofleriaceae bacterium]
MSVAIEHAGVDKSGRPDPSLPQVFGRYLLVQRLSRGGMGEIFVAKHGLAGFEKLCVIKKVLPNLAEDQQFISRFVDEAQVAIKLQHVNIAQVFEVGRVGDEYFLALEHVEGRDVRRTLTVLQHRGERFPVDLALFVGREIANGLAYAHRRVGADGASLGLVHCDISPPNVLVSFEGETKLIDFGIAKSVLRATATDPKMGFGKFGYMAPEQLIRGGVVDQRTDIYATGCVLYELLTGQRLYEVSDNPDYRALARMVARGEHRLPSDHDPMLAPYDELVAKSLKPRQDDRYQTAAELRDAIQHALVAVNPTISTDALGAFMRHVFADEMAAQRETNERLAKLHLADFRNELTTQSVATVSFALANMPLYAPATGPVAKVAATALPGELAQGSMPYETQQVALGSGATKRKWLWPAVIGGALVVGAIAFAMSGPDPQQTHAKKQVPVAPGSGSGSQQHAVLTEIQPDAVQAVGSGTALRQAQEGTGSQEEVEMPATVVDKGPRVDRHPKQTHVDKAGSGSASGSAAALDPAEVQAKFRAVLRDYRAFKERYGSRLEGEWADIATDAQYAKSPEKLKELDKKLDHFRAEMKSAQ